MYEANGPRVKAYMMRKAVDQKMRQTLQTPE
jgi:hypothetical protein